MLMGKPTLTTRKPSEKTNGKLNSFCHHILSRLLRCRRLLPVMALWVLCFVVASCDKAPRGVIGERRMADLLVDLDKAESYISQFPDKFPNDSAKQALKQSIFARHGVTQADYDSSMVWYAHNIDVYTDVCDKALNKLNSDLSSLKKKAEKGGVASTADYGDLESPTATRRRTYQGRGDTADIWSGLRTWMLTPVLPKGYITFDVKPDAEYRDGDRYRLNFKLIGGGGRYAVLIGADYADGTSTVVHRNSCPDGWTEFELQADRKRTVHRIYGYVRYDMTRAASVAFVDSLMLLRTHVDDAKYSTMGLQRTFDRTVVTQPLPSVPQRSQSSARSTQAAQLAGFTPKPGVNKSSHSLHVGRGVNDVHRGR